MTTARSLTIENRVDPRRGLYPGLSQHRFVCSCGKAGSWRNLRQVATIDGDRHADTECDA